MPYSLIQQVILLPLALLVLSSDLANAEDYPAQSPLPTGQSSESLLLIESINKHFNTHFSYKPDRDDLWLTREAFINRGGGDCEDFALAKYQSLMEAGMPASDFRFVYAYQKSSGSAHIALIHQPSSKVLDSLTSDTASMRQRIDLKERFRFSGTGFYPTNTQNLSRAELKTLQQWQAIIRRTEALALRNLARSQIHPIRKNDAL